MDYGKFTARLNKEMNLFMTEPPPGVSCVFRENSTSILDADIVGPLGSPYQGGVFQLEIQLPKEYPFQPPRVTFRTPIYHPNIDEGGRICLDLLKLPPSGSWRCTVTLSNVLMAIQCLLASPNPSDPLNPDIAELMMSNYERFVTNAREYMKKYCKTIHVVGGEAASTVSRLPMHDDRMDCE